MTKSALIDAVSTILTWDNRHPALSEKVRVVVTGHTGDVAIERITDNVFRVTTGNHGSQSIYRSRLISDPREAADLFVDALSAETIGYNLGGTQKKFESRFDPPAEHERLTMKQSMQHTVDHFEKLGKMYLKEAEKYRRVAAEEV